MRVACARLGVVLVLVVLGCAVVVAGVVAGVVLAGFVVIFDEVPDGAFDEVPDGAVPFGCVGAVVEDGVVGATGSPGFGSGLDVTLAINSLRPVSVPSCRYL